VGIEEWKKMIRWFIMLKKKMDYIKEINDLKKRIEESEDKIAILRVQYILVKSDRDRLKEIISEKN
jgi:hypothetical protein